MSNLRKVLLDIFHLNYYNMFMVYQQTQIKWSTFIEWMNERTNERTNERMNEWMNEWMNDWKPVCVKGIQFW